MPSPLASMYSVSSRRFSTNSTPYLSQTSRMATGSWWWLGASGSGQTFSWFSHQCRVGTMMSAVVCERSSTINFSSASVVPKL